METGGLEVSTKLTVIGSKFTEFRVTSNWESTESGITKGFQVVSRPRFLHTVTMVYISVKQNHRSTSKSGYYACILSHHIYIIIEIRGLTIMGIDNNVTLCHDVLHYDGKRYVIMLSQAARS